MSTHPQIHSMPDFSIIASLIAELDKSILGIANGRMSGIPLVSLRLPPKEPAVHTFYTAISWLYVCLIEAGPVHFRFLAERAKALGIDASESLISFRDNINSFRTVLQHNIDLTNPDDAAKLYSCEKWMSSVLGRPLVPDNRFWPQNGEWGRLASVLTEQAKQFIEMNLTTIATMANDEFIDDALNQWVLRFTRSMPAHRFDRIAEEVARDLGLTHLNVLKIRKVHLEKWNQRLRALPETADIAREARRVIEISFLAEAADYCPIDGQDVIQLLGIQPGPRVAGLLQRARELYRQNPCSRAELLQALAHHIAAKTE
jgi:hypothetical protein